MTGVCNHNERPNNLAAARAEMDSALTVMAHLETKASLRVKEHAEFIADHDKRIADQDKRSAE